MLDTTLLLAAAFVAGALGATLTVWVTFAPCFLWIFLGATYMEAVRANRSLSAALSGVTADQVLVTPGAAGALFLRDRLPGEETEA